MSEKAVRGFVCELLAVFYQKGWVAGTGGGICASLGRGLFLMAPTGVHKERVAPSDLFVVDSMNGKVVSPSKNRALRLSECGTIFCELIRKRKAGSVMHSHALSAVLAADRARPLDQLEIRGFEMLKGLRGESNDAVHMVPVINNRPKEAELLGEITRVVDTPKFQRAHCILVRDHGAYIWGEDIWETKRHAEVYHFLFEAVLARAQASRMRKI